MRERPILFSGAMVRAILDGRKTQTRRIVKPQPWPWSANPAFMEWRGDYPWTIGMLEARCPYGVPGDRLWVRETCFLESIEIDSEYRDHDGYPLKHTEWRTARSRDEGDVWFASDGEPPERDHLWIRRNSIHMPRWASRLTLEVTGVRVERVQEISAADACAEGVVDPSHGWDGNVDYPRARFAALWDEINGKRAPWSSNPWVWVVGFKRAS